MMVVIGHAPQQFQSKHIHLRYIAFCCQNSHFYVFALRPSSSKVSHDSELTQCYYNTEHRK